MNTTTEEKNIQQEIEIMAPAGSWESMTAAIQGGANSIYFGVEQLNMRARSSKTFTTEDLVKVAELCRPHGIRTYLTMNTTVYDHDLNLMKRILDAAKEAGITAVIAADHAVIQYASSIKLEIHISTQTNVTNVEAVKFWSNFADVVVLSRECSLLQIRNIMNSVRKDNICGPSGEQIQIEVFAHGALCMATSGTCYLSLHTENSSANRGACNQNCRRTYTVTDKESGHQFDIDNEYIMSPKDLCTISFIDQIVNTGVSVLKIEGRGRAPEYVKTVVRCYREAADAVIDGSFNEEKVAGWMSQLEKVYNRGFWDGYFLGQKMESFAKGSNTKATRMKQYIGRCENVFNKAGVGQFAIETHSLKLKENIVVIGPTTGVVEMELEQLKIDNKDVETAGKGDTITIAFEEKIRKGDKLYKYIPVLGA